MDREENKKISSSSGVLRSTKKQSMFILNTRKAK